MAAKKSAAPAAAPTPTAQTLLIITAKRNNFRRAGRAWPSTPTRINAADFTAEQLNALALEPMLTVTEAAD